MTTLETVRDRISQRSEKSRAAYLEEVKRRRRAKFEVEDCLQAIKLMLLLPARQEKKQAMNATCQTLALSLLIMTFYPRISHTRYTLII